MTTLDLYHRTSPAAARSIRQERRWTSLENTGDVYLSDREFGHACGYGTACVHVRVPVAVVQLDDEFPSGERHYRIKSSDLTDCTVAGVYGASVDVTRVSDDACRLTFYNGVVIGDAVRDVDGDWLWWSGARTGGWSAHVLADVAHILRSLAHA